jgi:hypothetical protein
MFYFCSRRIEEDLFATRFARGAERKGKQIKDQTPRSQRLCGEYFFVKDPFQG